MASTFVPGEDPIQLTNFDDAQAFLVQPIQPGSLPINLVRQRKSSQGFFSDDSKLIRCLTCIKVEDFQKYFDVTTE